LQRGKKIKVLFDYQAFEKQRFGGVSRYFSALINQLEKTETTQVILPIGRFENEHLRQLSRFKNARGLMFSESRRRQPFIRKIFSAFDLVNPTSNRNLAIRSLKGQDFDIFHPTYYDPYFENYVGSKPVVVTVHDMIHEIYSEHLPNDRKTSMRKASAIRAADAIITVSENTKRDLIRILSIPANKIHPIHLANSLQPQLTKPAGLPELPKRFILFVGSRSTYKNFLFFLRALIPLLIDQTDLCLIAAGGYEGKTAFNAEEMDIIQSNQLEKRVQTVAVDDASLAYLYGVAECFVFPSLYEGFGIPIVEAFACGCPVVASATSSLPEVGGEAALYFNPLDADDMLQQVATVVNSIELQRSMRAKGHEKVKEFSWEKNAKQTLEVYQSLLS
jgi:glycosyltransferase involved in cell wall biosynthesis